MQLGILFIFYNVQVEKCQCPHLGSAYVHFIYNVVISNYREPIWMYLEDTFIIRYKRITVDLNLLTQINLNQEYLS